PVGNDGLEQRTKMVLVEAAACAFVTAESGEVVRPRLHDICRTDLLARAFVCIAADERGLPNVHEGEVVREYAIALGIETDALQPDTVVLEGVQAFGRS